MQPAATNSPLRLQKKEEMHYLDSTEKGIQEGHAHHVFPFGRYVFFGGPFFRNLC